MTDEIPVDNKTLAQRIGRSPYYVAAMKSAGYEFTHGTRTMVRDALGWLKKHRDFRSTGYRFNAPGFVKDEKTGLLIPEDVKVRPVKIGFQPKSEE